MDERKRMMKTKIRDIAIFTLAWTIIMVACALAYNGVVPAYQ